MSSRKNGGLMPASRSLAGTGPKSGEVVRALDQRAARQVYGLNNPREWSTSQDPRLRPLSRVSVETLRTLARNYDILAACIAHLKSEVVKVVAKCARDTCAETKRQVQQAKSFLAVTGGIGGYGCHREEYEALLLDDLLIVGAGCSFLEYATVGSRRDGSPDAVTAIDAATIRPLVTAYGFAPGPQEDCYEQWVQGMRVAGFKRDELIYRGLPIFARTDSPYWLSPVELLVSVVYTALRADEWNRTWLTDGNTPDWWMKMPETMSPDQIVEWLDLFDTMMAGNAAQRHKVKVTPGEPRTGNARKEADFAQFEAWLMQRTCSVMGVNPASIGHHSDTYKDSQEIALKSTKEGRVAQLLAFRSSHYNELLERRGLFDVEVVDDVGDSEDAKSRAERHRIELESGQRTLNETRREDGLEPYDDPAADRPLVGSSLVALASLSGASEIVSSDDAVGRALRRFEKKALNRLREKGSAVCEFEDAAPPEEIWSVIADVLDLCGDAAEVRWFFDETGRAVTRCFGGGEVRRYDPNQPRDENGRWTGGGSGRTLGSLPAAGPLKETVAGVVAAVKALGSRLAGVSGRKRVDEAAQDSPLGSTGQGVGPKATRSDHERAPRELMAESAHIREGLGRLDRQLSDISRSSKSQLARIASVEKELQSEMNSSLSQRGNASSEEQRLSLTSQYQKAFKRHELLMDERRTIKNEAKKSREKVVGEMFDLISQSGRKPSVNPKITHKTAWPPGVRERIDLGLGLFSRVVGPNLARGLTLNVDRQVDGERSRWVQHSKTMLIEVSSRYHIATHEAGHALELNNPDIAAAAHAFLARRTLGEQAVSMNSIFPGKYGDDEFTKVDKFIHPYMGKLAKEIGGKPAYTEIISKGLEELVKDPSTFARKDPEMFDFLYGVVRNPAATRSRQENLLASARKRAGE